jgi:transcriptional regulator with XRE-family HTH domain
MDHGCWLNAKRLKELREELKWSQETLAKRSDLSLRVIAKAEGGRSIAPRTIESLIKAFRDAGIIIESGDLTTDFETLARQFLHNYVAHQPECAQESISFISPDIIAFVDGDPATNPIAGTYRGFKEFDGLWRKFFSIFVRDGGSLGENPEIKSIGNEVLAWGYECIRVPEAGPRPGGFVMLRMRFEGGLMTYFEDHYETFGMMRQLHEWAEEFPDAGWIDILNAGALQARKHLRSSESAGAPNQPD